MKFSYSLPRTALLLAATAGFALLSFDARAIELQISSVPGSEVIFTPVGGGLAEISFSTDSSGITFQVDGVVGGTGSAVGSVGAFVSFLTVGPASTIGGPNPLIETAPVIGGSLFVVLNTPTEGGLGIVVGPGTAASLTTSGVSAGGFSLTTGLPFLVSSSDPDIQEFFGPNRNISLSIAYTFAPSQTLADLIANGGHVPFSGTLSSTSVPESGATVGLLGFGLLGLAAIRRRI